MMAEVISIEAVLKKDESVFVICLCDNIAGALTNEERLSYLAIARRELPEIKSEFYRKMLETNIRKYLVY